MRMPLHRQEHGDDCPKCRRTASVPIHGHSFAVSKSIALKSFIPVDLFSEKPNFPVLNFVGFYLIIFIKMVI